MPNTGLLVQQVSQRDYNVRDFQAQGDGSHDDTTPFLNALSAANAAGGGRVLVPGRGQTTPYITSASLPKYNNVELAGTGYGNTVIKLKSGSNCDMIKSNNFDTLVGGNTTGGVSNFAIRDLTLDGNKAGNTSGRGMSIYGYGFLLENLRIRNMASHGIYSEWSTSSSSPGVDSMEAHVNNFKIHDCGGHGINWNGPHDSVMVNGQVFLNGTTNANYGIYAAGAAATGLIIVGTHCWGGAVGYQYYCNTTVKMVGCLGEGATIAQCLIRAGFVQIDDCWFFGAGVASSGIVLGLASDGTTSCRIRARCDGFSGFAIDYTNAGDNNDVEIHNYRSTSPTGIGGTPSGFNRLAYFEHADAGPSANSRYQFVGKVNVVPPADQVPLTTRGYFGGQTNNLIEAHDSSDNPGFIVDAWGRVRHQETANCSAAMQTGAGTSPPAAVLTGSSMRGFVTFGTGTSPSAAALIKITFAHAFTAAPKVVIHEATGATIALGIYLNPSLTTTTDFTVSCQTAPTASQGNTVYGFTYIVID